MFMHTGFIVAALLAVLGSGQSRAAEPCDLSTAACLRAHYSAPQAQWPPAQIDAGQPQQDLAPLPILPALDPARVALGADLFSEPLLSQARDIACSSCHDPKKAFADGLRVSPGHQQQLGTRNTPSVVAAALIEPLFWDGRSDSLEDQALKPIEAPHEMAARLPEVLHRLNQNPDYRQRFADVFDHSPIDSGQLASALADFQRSLIPRDRPLDRFLRGDTTALSDQQLQGLHLFRTKARCLNCHQGAALTDQRFHNLGLTYYGRKYEDTGRYQVTADPSDVGKFRTPSLRLVSQTGPWMHNGLFPNLSGVLRMYNAGMPRPHPAAHQQNDPLFPQTSELLQPLGLDSDELAALEAFLQAL
ncbi:cytochrome c peroxidase [Halopseudomonas aestusnigri]|uniref:cytochrome-c peroxidase n=1 Tax=Halopseudomonas aestusnigri TaxID=857252 RepID=UPI00255417C6|nr:cytochrome c peroxidase [Halopseudomonas aestusnigri]MDL2200101.1 cytochrome c peroxidase [Halopseudomonas aestusnigri]